jgi:hypothetical protein
MSQKLTVICASDCESLVRKDRRTVAVSRAYFHVIFFITSEKGTSGIMRPTFVEDAIARLVKGVVCIAEKHVSSAAEILCLCTYLRSSWCLLLQKAPVSKSFQIFRGRMGFPFMLLIIIFPGRTKCAASIKESDDDERADTSRRRLHRAITAVSYKVPEKLEFAEAN